MTVSEILDQTAREMRAALQHQRYQIADLRRDFGAIHDTRTLFGVNVNIQRRKYDFSFAGNRVVAHNLSVGPVGDLAIAVYERSYDGPLTIHFDGNRALHGAADLADRQQRFLRLLTGIADPDRAIGSLDILEAEERRTILREWNDTAHAVASATLPELFAAQVASARPMRLRWCSSAPLTYRALDARANQLAHHLRALGVGPESVVGLCVERSLEMVVGLLGILKAGGAYLPLDPGYPPARLAFMLEDAGARVLVTQSALLDRLPAHGVAARVPRCRGGRDRAASRHRAGDRARSPKSRLCHLHVGIHRSAERGRGRARLDCQLHRVGNCDLRTERRNRCAVLNRPGVRCDRHRPVPAPFLGQADLASTRARAIRHRRQPLRQRGQLQSHQADALASRHSESRRADRRFIGPDPLFVRRRGSRPEPTSHPGGGRFHEPGLSILRTDGSHRGQHGP